MLRHYVVASQDNWDELLPMAEYAYNNARHDSTGMTPFELNFGQHPMSHLLLQSRRDSSGGKVPAAGAFVSNMSQAIHRAKEALKAARNRQKAYADRNRRDREFKVGEQVLLSTKNLKLKNPGSPKFLPRFVGPFKVTDRIGKVAYRLMLPASMKCHPVFHIGLLEPYKTDGRVHPPPPPVAVDGELEFEVEQLLDYRESRNGRNQEYLVKWAGYGAEHNTWEPVKHLNCDKLVQEYWELKALLAQQERASRKGSTSKRPMSSQESQGRTKRHRR